MTTMEARPADEAFSTRIGLILSCMGCMVGTGNIWRFPRIIAENSHGEGCLIILLIWVVFLLLWSIPMLLIEYSIGRYTGKAVLQSFRQFLGDTAIWMGGWLTLLPLIIACWYSVVLGWCFFYTFHSIIKPLPTNHTDSKEVFQSFAVDSHWPVLTHAIAVFLASASVIKGGKTIEKVNLLFVPIFLTLIAVTFVWAISRDFATDGLGFLFSPDWKSFLSPRAFLDALCQNAFDTGAGMGLMVAFSAYMTQRNGIVKYATIIPCCNNLVSLICVMSIYSIVFSSLRLSEPEMTRKDILDVLQDSGPASTGLTFIWMPVLFSSVGAVGRAMAVIYFLCLSFAGVTSLIAYMEVAAQTAQNLGIPRRFGVPLCFCVIFLGGLPSAMSISVLVNQDFVWSFGLVISGLMFQSLVIRYGTTKYRTIVINEYSESDWYLPRAWEWVIKFIAPLEALVALIWWAVDLIVHNARTGVPWYQFKGRSFMATIVQWAVLMLILGAVNLTFIYCQSRKGRGDPTEEKPLELLADEPPSQPHYGTMPDSADPERNTNAS